MHRWLVGGSAGKLIPQMFEELDLVLDSVSAMLSWTGSLEHKTALELGIMSSRGQHSAYMETELVSIVVRIDNGILGAWMVKKQVWKLNLEMLT